MRYAGELITKQQAATLLRVHPKSIQAWGKQGILRTSRVGLLRERQFFASDVLSLLGDVVPSWGSTVNFAFHR